MLRPSGDHRNASIAAPSRVRRESGPRPFHSQISGVPLLAETYATDSPAGDHCGSRAPRNGISPMPAVSRVGVPPDGDTVHRSGSPAMAETNKIAEPSGDHCGDSGSTPGLMASSCSIPRMCLAFVAAFGLATPSMGTLLLLAD